MVAALGAGVSRWHVVEAAAAGIVAIAVPWTNVPAAVTGLQWDGQTVIDATNAWNADLGGRTSSEIVADLVPGARLVKAANTLAANVLAADPHEAGGRRVIFLSGDDAPAKAAVVELFDAAGFFPIDLGDLVTGGRMQQLGGPLPSGCCAPALVEAHLDVLFGTGLVSVHGDGAVVGPAVGRGGDLDVARERHAVPGDDQWIF